MSLSQNKDRKWVIGETVMKIRIPTTAGNNLLRRTTLLSQVKLCFFIFSLLASQIVRPAFSSHVTQATGIRNVTVS